MLVPLCESVRADASGRGPERIFFGAGGSGEKAGEVGIEGSRSAMLDVAKTMEKKEFCIVAG